MAQRTVDPDPREVQYLQQYLYLGIGWFSVSSSAVGVLLVVFTKQLRSKHPLFLAVYISGFITALSFVTIGFYRLHLLNTGVFFIPTKPSVCLKSPGLILHFAGSQLWNVFHFVLSAERLTYVAFPTFYANNYSRYTAKVTLSVIGCLVVLSLTFGALATLSFSATGQLIQSRCVLTEATGPIYGAYHYTLCVGLSTLAVLCGLISLGVAKYHIDLMKSKSNNLQVVVRSLNQQFRQVLTVMFITVTAYLLEITTYINNLFTVVGIPAFDDDSVIGKLTTISYCLSCGLNIFVLAILNPEIRHTLTKLFQRKWHHNSVQPERIVTIF